MNFNNLLRFHIWWKLMAGYPHMYVHFVRIFKSHWVWSRLQNGWHFSTLTPIVWVLFSFLLINNLSQSHLGMHIRIPMFSYMYVYVCLRICIWCMNIIYEGMYVCLATIYLRTYIKTNLSSIHENGESCSIR